MSRRAIYGQQSDQDILRRVEQSVADDSIHAHLRFVLVHDAQGKWVPGFGRIDLCRTGELEDVPQYEYKNARTIIARLPGKEFLAQLSGVLTGEFSFHCAGVSIGPIPKGKWDARDFCSHNQYSDWPCFYAELEMRAHAVDLVQGPLVTTKEAPYFNDALELVFEVSRFKTFHYGQDSRRYNLHLFIWDYRGRIAMAVANEDTLNISIDGAMNDLRLRGRIQGDEQEKQIRVDAQRQIVERLDEPPRKVELALITEDDEIIDLYERDFDTNFVKEEHDDSSLDALVDRYLLAGESAGVEYKPFVRLEADNGKGDDKKDEVVRTALAMVNARGGCILLGVNDQGVPNYRPDDWSVLKGRSRKELKDEGPPPQEPGGQLEKTVKEYGLKLRDLLQKR
ncbi:MAG TPA: hypothetical protein VEU33_17235, partial [Archangium sp.]|nr:hypothetical protein [Archangium sp.]